ncbi:MAG: hypothetical protein Q9M22_03440 [Mariprofundaceae bacterium]|nr:hypothetical protein [Mariprofundaceae bacterium]
MIMGIAEFRFFLAQEDMVAAMGVADVDIQENKDLDTQGNHSIHHVGHDYPLRLMPTSMKMNANDVRYYVLLQIKGQRFGLAANHLSFVPLHHTIRFSEVPVCMRMKFTCVLDVSFHDDGLLCASSAEVLYAVSQAMV